VSTQLPADITLGPVQLRVSDGAQSAAWLERVLGLRAVTPSGARRRHASAAGDVLVETHEVPGVRPVPRRGRLGLYHYALLLPTRADLGRFLVHLRALGEPFGASDHLFSEAIYLTDPDGITVEVYADRPREQWQYRDGEHGRDIVGAIDPLDEASVVAAAGTSRWAGCPALTRMGHLHFYVGDLAAAERFYVDGLGFAVSTRGFPGALFVAAGGYHHHVGLNVWAAHQPVAGPTDAGLDAWSLLLPSAVECQAVGERLRAAGLPFAADDGALRASDAWDIAVRITSG
jgi:catechol 2,3-dioxygenase